MKGGRFDHSTPPHSGYGQLSRLPRCAKTSLGLHFFSETFRSTQIEDNSEKNFFSVDTLMGSQEAKSDEVCLFSFTTKKYTVFSLVFLLLVTIFFISHNLKTRQQRILKPRSLVGILFVHYTFAGSRQLKSAIQIKN